MAIIHIRNASDLKAGDKAVFAPYGVPFFQNNEQVLEEQNGLVGFCYGPDNNFFSVTTPDGALIDKLILVRATRDERRLEFPENVGQEVLHIKDLPARDNVPVIVSHKRYGDYRGHASYSNGHVWVHLVDGVGHGSVEFWAGDGFKTYLTVNLDF